MPQTTGLPAGPTSTHRTQTTNYNCKRNAPGAPPRREGAYCRLSGTSLSAPRGAGCLPLGALCLARTPSFAFPMPLTPLPEHKNADFVLETPENRGSGGQKRTKTPILCSKCPKMRVPDPKKAQKPRFCARKDRDWHWEEQPWPSCKSPRTLLKYKYLITRQLTFRAVLGELKSRPPRGPMCPRGA